MTTMNKRERRMSDDPLLVPTLKRASPARSVATGGRRDSTLPSLAALVEKGPEGVGGVDALRRGSLGLLPLSPFPSHAVLGRPHLSSEPAAAPGAESRKSGRLAPSQPTPDLASGPRGGAPSSPASTAPRSTPDLAPSSLMSASSSHQDYGSSFGNLAAYELDSSPAPYGGMPVHIYDGSSSVADKQQPRFYEQSPLAGGDVTVLEDSVDVQDGGLGAPDFLELTRRGEDIGIGLGDFDMLDTLGTGTFGKVLLSRLRTSSKRPTQTVPHYFALKVLEKVTIVRLRQVEHLNSERSTLANVSHPFIVNLFCTFHDERNLYLLMEYVQGGELFSHLRRAGRFSSDVARFYAANLILALEYLHSKDIIYRDLKPENLLIDSSGYIKITDFGFAKHVPDRTYTLCGTPEYLAPEIITATGHGRAADYWAYGVLLFELLAGYPPFFDDNPLGIYEKILNGKFGFPPHIDFVAKDLIKRLLTADLSKRLGNLHDGADGIKNHRWFEGVDWTAVERKQIRAPIIPSTSTPGDTSNFERYPASPIEDLPGPLRAAQSRQYGIDERVIERGPDPYGYLFPAF